MSTTATPKYRALYNELQAIASCELAGPLATWGSGQPLSLEQAEQVDTYIREEIQAGGLLSAEHLRTAGSLDRREIAQLRHQAARFLLVGMES